MKLDVRVAVRLDEDAVRNAVEPSTFQEAEKLLASGRLGDITPVGGGAASIVQDRHQPGYEVWVGVTGGAFTAECDCVPADAEPDELCVHGVALTLGALRDGLAWSSVATPPSQVDVDPEVRRLAEVAATLPPRRLAMLLAEHAAIDRRLAARLLVQAGHLGPPTDAELTEARMTIDRLASDATIGHWDLHDIAEAGQWILDELEVLVQRPVGDGALAVVEHAAQVWDRLALHLHDAREVRRTDPAEIGAALRAIHVQMCEELEEVAP